MRRSDKLLATGTLAEILSAMTEKQRAFTESFLQNQNGKASVLAAGYEVKSGGEYQLASQLRRSPLIKRAIELASQERVEKSGLTQDYVLSKLMSTIEKCDGTLPGSKYDPNAVLRGLELLGRHLAMFRDRQEISGPDGGPIETKDLQDNADAFDLAIKQLRQRAENERVTGTDSGEAPSQRVRIVSGGADTGTEG